MSNLHLLNVPHLAACGAALFLAASAHARDPMVDLINAYRTAPASCEGRQSRRLPPLASDAGLAKIEVGTGTFLELALERAGYAAARADAIHVAGAADPPAVMAVIADKYCRTLLNGQFTQAGVRRNGDTWLIVFVQPPPPVPEVRPPDLRDAGQAILAAVNTARAQPRDCGGTAFAAADPLVWNDRLAAAALVHSEDMAQQGYFDHQGKDGRHVTERARAAGYRWRRVAENIAAGQEAPQEVVDGWLASPGHCANIMHPDFREMGAAYGVSMRKRTARIYWTQVFGTQP